MRLSLHSGTRTTLLTFEGLRLRSGSPEKDSSDKQKRPGSRLALLNERSAAALVFFNAVHTVARDSMPHSLGSYLYDLATHFIHFYE
jgi:arginyl-tRNA synthetase